MGHEGFHFTQTQHDAHAWNPSTQKVERGGSGVQDHHSSHREDILGYPKSVSERDQGRERGGFIFPNQNCSVGKNSPYSLPFVNYKINIFLNKELLRNHLLGADLEGPGPFLNHVGNQCKSITLTSCFFHLLLWHGLFSPSDTSPVRYNLCYRNQPFPEVTQETR